MFPLLHSSKPRDSLRGLCCRGWNYKKNYFFHQTFQFSWYFGLGYNLSLMPLRYRRRFSAVRAVGGGGNNILFAAWYHPFILTFWRAWVWNQNRLIQLSFAILKGPAAVVAKVSDPICLHAKTFTFEFVWCFYLNKTWYRCSVNIRRCLGTRQTFSKNFSGRFAQFFVLRFPAGKPCSADDAHDRWSVMVRKIKVVRLFVSSSDAVFRVYKSCPSCRYFGGGGMPCKIHIIKMFPCSPTSGNIRWF